MTTEISIATTTAPDGRFRLTGIGRERIAQMLVSSPTVATAELLVQTGDGPTVSVVKPSEMRAMAAPERTIYHARRFEFAAEPTRVIAGVIRDKDTGRPLAGITLGGMVFQEHSQLWTPGVEAVTDTEGRYRLAGLARGPAYRLSVEPGEGLPYPESVLRVPADSPGSGPVPFDIALKRGILVRGRVTDKVTGRPVGGHVQFHPFADNPHLGEFPGYEANPSNWTFIKDDGRYEVVALPGRGIIACRSDAGRYRGGVGAEAIKGYDPDSAGMGIGGFNTIGMCTVAEYSVFAEVNLDPGKESPAVDLRVDPGRTLMVTAIDPEGRPIAGTKVWGLTDLFGYGDYEQDSPTFEVRALDPSRPRRVTITHAGRRLIGTAYLKGDEAGPVTVRLQPWGAITGRVIDDDGQPRGPGGREHRRGLPETARHAGGPARGPDRPRRPLPCRRAGSGPPVRGIRHGSDGALWEPVPRRDRRPRRGQGPGRPEGQAGQVSDGTRLRACLTVYRMRDGCLRPGVDRYPRDR